MNKNMGLSAPALSPTDLRRIAKISMDISGIRLQEDKLSLIESRLARRLRLLGFSTYAEYCNLLESPAGADEQQELLSALTTNVTKFFREVHHFKFFETELLPSLIERAKKGRRVRIWSAGCSSGEEPYSIAMTILKAFPAAPTHDIEIVGTDIDPKILATAREGQYSGTPGAHIDPMIAKKYFKVDQTAMTYAVTPEVKKLVSFKELNLHSRWNMSGRFDAIFCRNVTIYFNKNDEIEIWKGFARHLNREGYLFVGHSERIPESAGTGLTLCGTTTYRPVG